MIYLPDEAANAWFEKFGYDPGPSQRKLHQTANYPNEVGGDPAPRLVFVGGGEQAGKSTAAAAHTSSRWLLDDLVWLAGNRYEDCEEEYRHIAENAVAAGIAKTYSTSKEGPWELVYINGHIVQTIATEDVTKIARKAPAGIIMCEPGRQTYEAFEYLYRRCIPKTAWMLVPGTFEGDQSEWYADLAMGAMGENSRHATFISIPSWENSSLYPEGIQDPKLKAAFKIIKDSNPANWREEIEERFAGIPRKPKGRVFDEFTHTRHVTYDAEFNPMFPVHLAVDPGYYPSSYAVLFLQRIGEEIRQFDELYLQHLVTTEVITLVKNHKAFGNVSHVVLDVAAKQHGQGQQSALETWQSELGKAAGGKISIGGEYLHVDDGIARTHDKLRVNPITGRPYFLVHPRCKNTVWEFAQGYRRRVSTNGVIRSDTPIDANNHAVKALAYYIVNQFSFTDVDRRLPSNRVLPPGRIQRTFARRR